MAQFPPQPRPHRLAALAWLLAALWLAAWPGPAAAGLVRGEAPARAVVLLAGGPGGQRDLQPLANALAVGGHRVSVLAPELAGGLAGMAPRLERAVNAALAEGAAEVDVICHGAGCLPAARYLRGARPAEVRRALFLGLPGQGLTLPPAGGHCRDDWRRRVEGYYTPPVVAEAGPGAALALDLGARGLPLDILAGSIAGGLDAKAAEAMLPRAGCEGDLARLPGDGVVAGDGFADLPGVGRDHRQYQVAADHLALPANRQAIAMALRFLRLAPRPRAAAVVVAVDASGSVRQTDRAGLRHQALANLIARLAPGDQAGVVTFNTSAATALPLTGIESRPQARRLAGQRLDLPAKGDTDIGAGLMRAGELLAGARPGGERIVVLLTDGRNDPETANAATLERAKALAAAGATLHAVGLTERVDELFLARLAELGRGRYLYARDAGDLTAIFDRLQADIDGAALVLAQEGRAPGQAEFLVDGSMERVQVSLAGADPKLGLGLVGPDGLPAAAEAAQGPGLQTLSLRHPAPGTWRVTVAGPAGAAYQLQAAADTGLTVSLKISGQPEAGQAWPLELAVEQDDQPLAGTSAQIAVNGPAGQRRELEIRSEAGRGFSASRQAAGALAAGLEPFARPGRAELRALVSGRNRQGQPFARLVLATLYISDVNQRQALGQTLAPTAPRLAKP